MVRFVAALALATGAAGCSGCYGPINHVEHVRLVKRIQPGASSASYGPTRPLEWGQLNFLHTTDTHGWLEGHIKEQNYGADWGDFVSFAKRFRHTAATLDVDLLLIDTGDLHDGTGFSDSTSPDGIKALPIFDNIDYDVLTIGNHELYVSEVAFETYSLFAKTWGDKYLTSNVKIFNQTSGQYEYPGKTYRYFTTPKGIRILAFGVLFDFTGNSNASQVIKAQDMVQQQWFKDALNMTEPVDLFLLIGHNAARRTAYTSTMGTIWDSIRAAHPTKPIQVLGGHTHVRDFYVYDESSVGMESGRYCETLGWLSMSGFNKSNSGFKGPENPGGVPNPARKATNTSAAPWAWSRRYLDWNRNTFIFHTTNDSATYDLKIGLNVSGEITEVRTELNLGELYGCVPQTYCMYCVPFTDPGNIFPSAIVPAMSQVVVNASRTDKARILIGNTGAIRFDLHKGPFTYDDNFIVSPYTDVWLSVLDVPYSLAQNLLNQLNAAPSSKRELGSMPLPRDSCVDPVLGLVSEPDDRRESHITRRQVTGAPLTPGWVTTDDFGTDGDDTAHSSIPDYNIPDYFGANVNFPSNTTPGLVDVIFLDIFTSSVLEILGSNYTQSDVGCYISCNFTAQDFMIPWVKSTWQAGLPNCPI